MIYRTEKQLTDTIKEWDNYFDENWLLESEWDYAPIYDIISGKEQQDPECVIQNKERVKFLDSILGQLSPKEEKVLRMHFGLRGYWDAAYTLPEMALVFDVTTTRIRQIEARALRKLGKFKKELSIFKDKGVSRDDRF